MTPENIPDEYISANILQKPNINDRSILKGAIILSQVDYIVKKKPEIKKYFFLIERRGWRGLNESLEADIKLVEDLSYWDTTLTKFPDTICLDIGPADFVDTDAFHPIETIVKEYAGIQISSWDVFKRPELFVNACALHPDKKFIKLGHYIRRGNSEELSLMEKTLELTKKINANINYPYANFRNKDMPKNKYEVNRHINKAKIGILTSSVEGINRFKMECLSANIPFLVPEDAAYPTKKHINEKTGLIYSPNPEGLAHAITETLDKIGEFSPREYILRNTGKKRSLAKLRSALEYLSMKESQNESFANIDWDGRNNNMIWGRDNVFREIDYVLNYVHEHKPK